jgi:hypothetical protein
MIFLFILAILEIAERGGRTSRNSKGKVPNNTRTRKIFQGARERARGNLKRCARENFEFLKLWPGRRALAWPILAKKFMKNTKKIEIFWNFRSTALLPSKFFREDRSTAPLRAPNIAQNKMHCEFGALLHCFFRIPLHSSEKFVGFWTLAGSHVSWTMIHGDPFQHIANPRDAAVHRLREEAPKIGEPLAPFFDPNAIQVDNHLEKMKFLDVQGTLITKYFEICHP